MQYENAPAVGGATARADGFQRTGSPFDYHNSRKSPIELGDIRFQRAVARFHRLGERALGEMLAELGARFLLRTEIEGLVERYINNLDPVTVEVVGGRNFAAIPLRLVDAGEPRP